MIHPLFAALPDDTNFGEFITNLGFEIQTFQLDREDTIPDIECDGQTISYASDAWLTHWHPDCPAGFETAATWKCEDGPIALFVKPTTPFATALWLIGLGQMTQNANHPKVWAVRTPPKTGEDPFYQGQFESAEAAMEFANSSNPPGTPVEAARFAKPLASRYAPDGDDIANTMSEAADEHLIDGADPYPDATPEALHELEVAVNLLIDGWATHTGNHPNHYVHTPDD